MKTAICKELLGYNAPQIASLRNEFLSRSFPRNMLLAEPDSFSHARSSHCMMRLVSSLQPVRFTRWHFRRTTHSFTRPPSTDSKLHARPPQNAPDRSGHARLRRECNHSAFVFASARASVDKRSASVTAMPSSPSANASRAPATARPMRRGAARHRLEERDPEALAG